MSSAARPVGRLGARACPGRRRQVQGKWEDPRRCSL